MVRMSYDPKCRKHGFDFFDYGRKSALKLMRLRKSFAKELYPKAVVHDLLMDAYAPELAWPELVMAFQGVKMETDYSEAIEKIEKLLNRHRLDIYSRTQSIITPTFRTGTLSFSFMLEIARLAVLGDNKKAEDLEFSFVCFSARYPVLIRWAALGLMGFSKVSAYYELVDAVYSDPETGRECENFIEGEFSDVIKCFDASIAFSMAGETGRFTGAYQQLSPLF